LVKGPKPDNRESLPMSLLNHERERRVLANHPRLRRNHCSDEWKLMTGLGIVPIALLAAVLLTGCGSSRRGEPFVGPLALESHPGGEAGVGPAFTNKPLPMFLVRAQVRYGLGAMPTFTRGPG